MTLKRLFLTVPLLALLSSAALASDAPAGDAADAGPARTLTAHTFTFKFKDAAKAAETIKPLLSSDGSISIPSGTRSVVVTDHPENVKQITASLAQFDTPARAFKLSVRIVSAARVDAAPAVATELRDIAPKLAMLRFNSLENLGAVDVEGKEGEPGLIDLPSGYRADFHFGDYDAASDSIRVSDLHLSRLSGPQKDQLTSLLKTSLNLRLGQTVILGASKVPESQRALMIVLLARR